MATRAGSDAYAPGSSPPILHLNQRVRRPVDQGPWGEIGDHGGREIGTLVAPERMDGPIAHDRDDLRCVEAREGPRSGIASMSRTTTACHPINAAPPAGGPARRPEDRDDVEGDAGKDMSSHRREYPGRATESPLV